MPFFDAPVAELRTYRSAVVAPDDLDAYWHEAIADARAKARPAVFEPYRQAVYRRLDVSNVAFTGAGGDPVRGWFVAPQGAGGELPCRVTFIGYGGGRGHASDHTLFAAAGCAQLVVDTRGQGADWTAGATGDPGAGASGPEVPGVMTRGILDRENYLYRRLYVDAVRAVETAAEHERVDAARIGVGGFSQGGGLSLAVSALLPDRVALCQALHRQRRARPPDPGDHHGQRRPDGCVLPAVDRLRRVQRDHGPQAHHRVRLTCRDTTSSRSSRSSWRRWAESAGYPDAAGRSWTTRP